ncbi:MAG: hypothetical protein JJU26_13070 [Oceanicaulis sp.]|uniref:hypothetical protein n=1 Tax=Glycocaulis sp. TaxID=1969725 RepID=UPI0025C625EE|nr:hypothetical protein [Glycocaulis sp.]MCC5982637.1 hypothetical protein [Oceanicaulis sp.]MCH8522360.1 hypothetical protein [Glycocaulis sp.]
MDDSIKAFAGSDTGFARWLQQVNDHIRELSTMTWQQFEMIPYRELYQSGATTDQALAALAAKDPLFAAYYQNR